MKSLLFFLFAVLCPALMFSQETVQYDFASNTRLTSKAQKVWDRRYSECTVQLKTLVSDTDTLHTLCFVISDRKGVGRVYTGEPLIVRFEDGREIQLKTNHDYLVDKNVSSMFMIYGFIPFFYSFNYEQVSPQYEITTDDLLSIVGGRVSSLTFFMDGQPYDVNIRSNRFALAVGESCASLKSSKRDGGSAKVNAKSIFGDARLRYNTLGWNNRYSFSLGMGHMYSHFDSRYFSHSMPVNMFTMDMAVKGLYLGFGIGSHTEDGYLNQTFAIKAGPAFKYGNLRSGWVLSPYLGVLGGESRVDEYRSKIVESRSFFIAGLRAAYEYRHLQVAVNFSNRECGAALGVVF